MGAMSVTVRLKDHSWITLEVTRAIIQDEEGKVTYEGEIEDLPLPVLDELVIRELVRRTD